MTHDKRPLWKSSPIIILIIAIVGFLGWYLWTRPRNSQEPDSQEPGQPTLVRLALNPVPHSALPVLAAEKGIFKKHGLLVEVNEFPTGKLCFDAMLGGAAQFSTVAETPVMFAGFTKQPVFIIATIESSKRSLKILARKDRGVSQPADLRGKRIGTFKGGSAEYFLSVFLKKHNISTDEVKLTFLTPPELITAIARGDLDAISMWEPIIFTARKSLGEAAIVFVDEDLYTETFNIVTTRNFAHGNEKTVVAFLRSLIEAETFLKDNRREASDILLRRLALAPEALDSILQDFNFKVELRQDLAEMMRKQAVFVREGGTVASNAEIPNYTDYLAPQYLREISAQRAIN